MDIAIKYEKFDLGYDKFVFKPVGIMKGTFNEEEKIFEPEYGNFCVPINGESPYEEDYFGCLTTMNVLNETYDGLSESEILTSYFEECSNNYWLGYFDDNDRKLNVLSITCESIEKMFEANINEKSDEETCTSNNDMRIYFTMNKLKELRNTMTIDELHSKLDQIIEFATMLNKEEVEIDSPEEEKETKTKETGNTSKETDLEVYQENSKKKTEFSIKRDESKQMNLKELRKAVKDKIKGEDKAVNDVTRAIVINENSKNNKHKSHILIIGPSGTGKTEMINIISQKLKTPFIMIDATSYTKEGYKGMSTNSILSNLISLNKKNLAVDENGVYSLKAFIAVDEIDKKLEKDISGIDVLFSFLKMMDRGIVEVETDQGYGAKSTMLFDTSQLTFIFMGAFSELYTNKSKEKNKFIGFGDSNIDTSKETITKDDLIKAGIPPEFLGRISVITQTEKLEIEDLVEILYKSKGGAIDLEREFCKELGITLKFTSGYMKEIATKAYKTNTGARNLKSLVTESLADAYDQILSGKKAKVLKLSKATALDSRKYFLE